jgi:hypothetical protein
VKLCRLTKHQLRGRGGCYKHSIYGITSYQCMEATPSLACANKYVFCWRHHKNPVGREWRWKTMMRFRHMPNDRPWSCFPHGVKGVTFCGKSDASNRYTAARACQEDSDRTLYFKGFIWHDEKH